VILEAFAAALVCIDPGHGTLARVGAQREPIGPDSPTLKIKDPGGAPGEADVVLDIALRTRALLAARGLRVAMTRTRAGYPGGNVERARFCNARDASLMLRIHADGSTDRSLRGVHTLYPALRRGWTDDIYAKSVRAARVVQGAVIDSTDAHDLGLQRRSDLTGFNWADVPVVLVETGFLSNPQEARQLHSPGYRARIARGLAAGAAAFVAGRPNQG
jgi:N-acetylmuramoyl-L-alanine amidase